MIEGLAFGIAFSSLFSIAVFCVLVTFLHPKKKLGEFLYQRASWYILSMSGTQPLRVLHLDSHLMIVLKPALMLTVPHVRSTSPSLLDLCVSHLRSSGMRRYLQSVHRLDYGVGGVVAFGRSDKGVRRMNRLFGEGGVEKRYLGRLEVGGGGAREEEEEEAEEEAEAEAETEAEAGGATSNRGKGFRR